MTTIINGPSNGSTTYRFNNQKNRVIGRRGFDYTILLKGNDDSGIGGRGDDKIDGGTGFDQLEGRSGADTLKAGRTSSGGRDQNELIGDTELIKVGRSGGSDNLYGGAGCIDRLIGDSRNLYGTGGRDRLFANGIKTELIGDALQMQASSIGGNDVLTGAALSGSRTIMYGDTISAYGPIQCGDDELISGLSDDLMYGDYQFAFPAPFANDPFVFDIYDQYGFFTPPTDGAQPFTYTPIIFDLSNQDPSEFEPDNAPPNSQIFTLDVAELDVDGFPTGNTTTESWVIPTNDVDNLAPQAGADQFVFRSMNEGTDVIMDFNQAEGDKIVFLNGLQATDEGSKFRILDGYMSNNTLVTFGMSSILLPDVSDLTISAFAFAA